MKKMFSLALSSFVCGIITGIVVFLFKFIAKNAEKFSRLLFSLAKDSLFYLVLISLLVLFFVFVTIFIQKKVPECKGGGISRSKKVIENSSEFKSIRVLFATFTGSLVSFFSSLTVGTEGPSVLMGTSIGSLFKNDKYIMISGAGAGFAAATGTVFAPIFFLCEEIHKRFELSLIFVASFGIFSSNLTNTILCNIFKIESKLFSVQPEFKFNLYHFTDLFFVSVIAALCVLLFELLLKATKKIHIPLPTVFVLSAACALLFDSVVYSGHNLSETVFEGKFSIRMLVFIIVLRIFFLVFVKRAGVTGGVFLPSLAIGALAGAIGAKLLIMQGFEEHMFLILTLFGMCAFIGAFMKAPLMACVFYIELTGQISMLPYIVTVVFLTYALTEALEKRSV